MSKDIYLGVVYEPTEIQMGLVTRCGKIEAPLRVKIADRTQRNTVPKLIRSIQEYLSDKAMPRAIGIGLPGYVNPEKGQWMHCLRMGIRQPIALAASLEQAFSVPVRMDNDLNAATLAENYYGIGRISRDFLFVLADEAVAMGIVADGRLLRGVANCVGELGHLMVDPDGELCACNARGCLEPIVASDRIVAEAAKNLIDYPQSALAKAGALTPDLIFAAAESGDELALKIAQRVVRALGIGLVNAVNLLNPEHIVLTGWVCRNAWLLEQVKKYVYAHGFVSSVATLKDISPSALQGDFAYVLGAASLCSIYEN